MEGIMSSKLFTTRQGTILLGVIAAVIAAVALIVYLNQYRNSINSKNATSSVLVAKSLIQKGTPGNVVGTSGLYEISKIPKTDVTTGAFIDPATLTGKVATTDIYPGQQLTSSDFGPATNSLTQQLGPNDRAVVVPLGTPQEVGGQIAAGSHVDVWVALTGDTSGVAHPVVQELLQNVYVLGASGGNVTLKATPQEAGKLIFATENAQLWLVLRPTIASTQKKPPSFNLRSVTGG